MRFTDRSISSTKPALPASKSEAIFFDDDAAGFGLRVRKSGARSWVFQYWLHGKAHRMTLGPWPKVTASQARAMVPALAAKVALGHDPAAAKNDARARKDSFGEIVGRYLAAQTKRLRPRSFEEVERHLTVHAKPLHGVPIEMLSRRDVAELLATISSERGPVAHNRVRASISAAFVWAIKAGLAETNVAALTNKEKERARDRVLTGDELAAIWKALPTGDYSCIVKLLMLTGQRREEIGGLRWSEIDLKRGLITLPPTRTKNARQHTIPVSDPARTIIAATPKAEGRDFVFGEGEGSFSGWSRCKERLDATLGKMPPWTLHDIRRGVATGMAEIGIQPHIIEAVLNHVSGHKDGVAGIYNRAAYDAEKRTALDKWAKHVMRTVRGLSVVA
jgi:integrase